MTVGNVGFTMRQMTREAWLEALIEAQRPLFKQAGIPHILPPKIRASVGWPSSRAFGEKRAIGECWLAETTDGIPQIFVSPYCDKAEDIAHIMLHELIHATGCKGHKGDFRHAALALGLLPPMPSTTPGPALSQTLNKIIKKLGKYPHTKLDKNLRKKQGTRLIKIFCAADGYTARITRKWLDDMGTPSCPCGEKMLEELNEDGE